MTHQPTRYRFYDELAAWWPLISPAEEYAEESAYAASILREAAVRDVLELGSGGGHSAVHLKASFAMTLLDLSEEMSQVSRRLNPDCEHHVGDMRSARLGRTFDAVFIHDAVDYMVSETDLSQAMRTAFVHCRPGGIALFVPDHTVETFEAVTEHGGADGPDGSGARYLAWTWDPDPRDTWIVTDYAFVLRAADGSTRVVHEAHRTGLFSRDTWLRLLADSGFSAALIAEQTAEERTPRHIFVGHRPVSSSAERPGPAAA